MSFEPGEGPICRTCGQECDAVFYLWDREARVYDTYCSVECRETTEETADVPALPMAELVDGKKGAA